MCKDYIRYQFSLQKLIAAHSGGRKNSPGMRIETLVVNGYIDLCLVNRDTFRFTTPIRLK